MSNTKTIGLVLAAATLSLVLASHMQSGPSLLADNRPAVPGVKAWQKAMAGSEPALIEQR